MVTPADRLFATNFDPRISAMESGDFCCRSTNFKFHFTLEVDLRGTWRQMGHSDEEEWYFAIYDIVAVLTDSSDPKQYIKKMRTRDKELNSKWGTICTPLPMIAHDGKI